MRMTTSTYSDHRGAYDGYCPRCDAITRDGMTEPDAQNYPCPDCGANSVLGMEMALVCDHLDIVDDAGGPPADLLDIVHQPKGPDPRDVERARFVVVLLINQAGAGDLRGLVHRGAEEEAGLDRVAVEDPVPRKRVEQHGDNPE